ncbi:helix-turn-helix domain-containing protein [Tsuneonella rigui]|uniref:helix-turn-helix domain-containing protein n=1 Tax=Tsuneonella rigui TaxID=1708790 RepID=UPI000F7E127E|nr:helix-turn-helix domain-containing protein [Tsuneonella rigui]
MAGGRANPYKVKLHFSYTAGELATCLGVHKNTVRNWRREGLAPVDEARPILFQGAIVRAFLLKRNARRKQPCPPGTLYCLRCRQPSEPARDMVEYSPIKAASGNLRATCSHCGAVMHRRIREADITRLMPGCTVQHRRGHSSLIERADPSLKCDLERAS